MKNALQALLPAQFIGAFLDNVWKLFVTFTWIGAAGEAADFEASSQEKTTLVFVAFSLPLMLFSLPACHLADRFSKRDILVGSKFLELACLIAATVTLWLHPAATVIPLLSLSVLGMQSAFFSPAKYGILPELVPHARLSQANGSLELWSFLAIIGGTAAGGPLFNLTASHPGLAGTLLCVLSLLGLWIVRKLPRTEASSVSQGIGESIRQAWRTMSQDRVLRLAVIGSALFWTLASLLGQDILVYSRVITRHLEASESLTSLPLAVLGLGVGLGSVAAGKLSARKVEYGLIPVGAVGLATFTLLLALLAPGLAGTMVLLGFAGLAGGLIIVPINALHQWRPPAGRRGGVIALSNFFTFGGVLAGSLGAMGLSLAGLSAQGILVALALLTLVATCWALWLLPQAFLRLTLVLLTHSVYRLRVLGREQVPSEGGALLVPNHVSFVDGLLIMASTDREVRFLVDRDYYDHSLLRWFLRGLKAIPISSAGGPKVVLRALKDAGQYLEAGELVCIFPEGQLTRNGMLQPFRRGLERIVKGRDVPIIPVHLDRIWGSIFSRSGGRFLTKLPERIPYPVTVSYGDPVEPGVPLHEVRRRVVELGEAAWSARKADRAALHRTFISRVRRRPWRIAVADASGASLSRVRVLAGALALARTLRDRFAAGPQVGVLLPPSPPGLLSNVALSLAGKVSVNLNYTLAQETLESVASQANLQCVLTSRRFLEKVPLQLPEGATPIYLEDVKEEIGGSRRLLCLLLALFAPKRLLERYSGMESATRVDDIATVIFSSGSTGQPKGVLLSHFNIDSNVAAATQVLHVTSRDTLLGVLPLFHSFGTMSMWFALQRGMTIVTHPNPLDAAVIGGLIQRHAVTVVLATPTFLQLYQRRCTPAQFGSVRLIVTGAEKLSPTLASSFEDQFGVRLLEGYGTTECAPVVATSGPDFRAPGFFQPGARRGYVGQALPGVALRIVDPDAAAPEDQPPLPPQTPGLLLVRGPNVMAGYLGQQELTDQVLRKGWYVTGDIALLDEDGFLKITDRLSRFSKIGGEMVPHGKVEEALHAVVGSAQQCFAVTAVPDARKGERLAVLYTLAEAVIDEVVEKLKSSGLPNLFLPRREDYVRVQELPVLGTGKLDLRQIKERARAALEKAT